MTTLHEALTSLRADVYIILKMRGYEFKTALVDLVEDTILVSLLSTATTPPEPRKCAKRPRSSRTIDGYYPRVRKKERTDIEAVRRDSLLCEETFQMRARELAAGASSYGLEDA